MSLQTTVRRIVERVVPERVASTLRRAAEHVALPADFSPEDVAFFRRVAPYTLTSPERVIALRDAVRYLVERGVPGAFVECGVWRGGSMMAVAHTLRALGERRELYLFDTFEGMPAPSELDVTWRGLSAQSAAAAEKRDGSSTYWCIADEADVRANLASTSYPAESLHFVRGKVEDTLAAHAPGQLALLRLDTDFYSSTRHELELLYPRLASGGVLIIDDYGHWEGARKAVDEYFAQLNPRPLLTRVDYTCRLAIRP
jgi:O-methyltransferase